MELGRVRNSYPTAVFSSRKKIGVRTWLYILTLFGNILKLLRKSATREDARGTWKQTTSRVSDAAIAVHHTCPKRTSGRSCSQRVDYLFPRDVSEISFGFF